MGQPTVCHALQVVIVNIRIHCRLMKTDFLFPRLYHSYAKYRRLFQFWLFQQSTRMAQYINNETNINKHVISVYYFSGG